MSDYAIKKFEVSGISYVAEYSDNEISFYADVKSSRKNIIDYDSLEYEFGDDVDEMFEQTESLTTKNIFAIKKNLLEFLDHIISRFQPYYFTYSANEKSKVAIYEKIGERIAAKYGYFMMKSGIAFTFYKKSS